MLMNETILTNMEKQVFLETLDAVRMEAKVSAGDGQIISFANRVRSFVRKTGIEVIPVFCGIRLYSGAREEAQKQKIVLVGDREIRNEIPLTIFTIKPQDL